MWCSHVNEEQNLRGEFQILLVTWECCVRLGLLQEDGGRSVSETELQRGGGLDLKIYYYGWIFFDVDKVQVASDFDGHPYLSQTIQTKSSYRLKS